MIAIILKLVLTPILIAVATLAARRYGPALGGWLAGLPLVSGPVSIFLALDEGPDFAAAAALAGLLGLVAVAGFCVTYVLIARKGNWLPAALAGIGAYLLCAIGLARLSVGPAVAFFLALAAIFASRTVAGHPSIDTPSRVPAWWDIPLRMASAAAMVLAITECALSLGARWSGLLAPFPVFASIMAVFTHRDIGQAGARRLLSGVMTGSAASASFFLCVGMMVRHHSLLYTYSVSAGTALAVSWTCLLLFVSGDRR
ncbi:MAG TPA: hypothetical protein VLW86_00540 [Syntrophorhabdales bacterium]|nr:hypothetical protein [Syntrophorhabdales bacterium]